MTRIEFEKLKVGDVVIFLRDNIECIARKKGYKFCIKEILTDNTLINYIGLNLPIGSCENLELFKIEPENNNGYITLKTYQSSSNPNKKYAIKQHSATGKISCNCPSWIFKNNVSDQIENKEYKIDRICKHIEKYIQENGKDIIDYEIENNDDKNYVDILEKIKDLKKI